MRKSLIVKGKMSLLGAAFVSPLMGVGGTRKRRRLSHWEPIPIHAVQSGWKAVQNGVSPSPWGRKRANGPRSAAQRAARAIL